MQTSAPVGRPTLEDDRVATAREIAAAIDRLRRARAALAARSTASIIAALDDVTATWLAPDSIWRARAEALLPDATGFSAAMIRDALPTMLEPLRPPALAQLIAREAGARRGPALILHVLPGNLPGLAAIPITLSLAVGSAVLCKAGAGDRVFPELFTASIVARDAELGRCVAAHYWPGGDRACESAALGAADLVVASGNDATITDLAARTPGRFIGHGHRVSFAVVARESAADAVESKAAAARLAEDVAVWDQRGCLSPQLCFVEGDVDTATAFAAAVAAALDGFAARWPAAAATTGERLDVRRFRDAAEWRRLGGGGGAVFTSGSQTTGTVVVDPELRFAPSPLCRSLRVMAIPRLHDLSAVLAPVRAALEGAGIAAPPDRLQRIAAELTAAGVHRVCAVGQLQRPPLDWRQGGRPRLADWIAP
jgi:hypothetical protein